MTTAPETAPGSQPDATKPPMWSHDPKRIIGRGHSAGDFLEAYEWTVTDEDVGRLSIDAHLPDHVKNPRDQLFGGFTGTYVDLVVLFTVRAGPDRTDFDKPRNWLTTTNMRIDYFAPVTGPRFRIESQLEHGGGRSRTVSTRFYQGDTLAVMAITSVLEIAAPQPERETTAGLGPAVVSKRS